MSHDSGKTTLLNVTLTRLPLNARNRMVRLGGGLHDGRWFVRVDLWWVGYRLTRA